MADGENISLREYIDKEIQHLKEIREESDKALRLQADEYERRLEQLNESYARIDKIVAERIARDIYERDMKELNGKIEAEKLVSKDFVTRNELTGILQPQSADIRTMISYKDVQSGKNTMIGVIVAIFLSLIGAAGGIISLFK